MGKMSREDLFREIGEIDEAYVEEARRAGGRRRQYSRAVKALAAAASLALCVGVGYMALQVTQPSAGQDSAVANNASGASGGTMNEEAAQEQYLITEAECQDADGAVPEEEPTVGQADANSMPEAAPVAQSMQDSLSDTESMKDRQSRETQQLEGKQENAIAEDAAQEVEELCASASSTSLDWEGARTDAVYGKYVDVQVPEGYSYTSGVRTASGLHVIWSKGMEEISVSCRQADEAVSDWLVDVEKAEEYDLRLYTIPWCDSVPQELIQKVKCATFHSEQLTRELVAARAYQAQEQGDTGGWRVRLAILYSDNVLVEISSKGPAPEEICELINLEN